METYRENLTVDKIYFEKSSGQYFVTPDGVGCYWYDSLAEAQEQHGDTGRVITVTKLSDF